jgi:hypothetical protein
VAIGPVWIGRAAFGSRDANETTGTGGTFRLFTSSSELASAPGVEAHVGVRVMRALEAEASGSYTRPALRVTAADDVELSNAPLTISDTIQQFTVGGAALWYPRVPHAGGRIRPFVRGGAGYLRQVENNGALVVTGRTYEAGGGVKFLLTSRETGWWKGIGARLDARALARIRGVTLDARAHVSPSVSASIFLRLF